MITPLSRSLKHSLAVSTTVLAVCALSSCSSNDTETTPAANADQGSQSTAPAHQEPLPEGITPASLILDDSATPDGFTHTPPDNEGQAALAELLNDPENPSEPPSVDPPNCAGLIIDGSTFLTWMSQPADTTTTTNYTRTDNEEQGVFIMVTTTPTDSTTLPTTISDCASFTKTTPSALGTGVKTFEATDDTLTAQGADVVTAANVTSTANTIDGESVGSDESETLHVLIATTRGVTFTIAADESVPADEVSALAAAQAERINNA
ncbi:hypothetical protein [Corynebacterium variabile]|uniref:hypothetical protein n=1 Tax=Corynebacterium variabile TaxID=1727 RepID=UPI0028A5CCFC|nr:hypothetical protein [Corynebacterium variabile]